jgi:hypothetical protein
MEHGRELRGFGNGLEVGDNRDLPPLQSERLGGRVVAPEQEARPVDFLQIRANNRLGKTTMLIGPWIDLAVEKKIGVNKPFEIHIDEFVRDNADRTRNIKALIAADMGKAIL